MAWLATWLCLYSKCLKRTRSSKKETWHVIVEEFYRFQEHYLPCLQVSSFPPSCFGDCHWPVWTSWTSCACGFFLWWETLCTGAPCCLLSFVPSGVEQADRGKARVVVTLQRCSMNLVEQLAWKRFNDFAHIPWEDTQTSPNPHKGRNSFINCWWNVRNIFQGYVGEIIDHFYWA